jgi:RsmE family RNA methyltransferase
LNIILFDTKEAASGCLFFYDPRVQHLAKTLHKKEGDVFDAGVFDAGVSNAGVKNASVLGGKTGKGSIVRLSKEEGLVFTLKLDSPPPPRADIRLGVGFPRPIQLRRILREAANLGIRYLDIFGTELGEKSYCRTSLFKDGAPAPAARSAMLEGLVQARDTIFPEVRVFGTLAEWLENLNPPTPFLALDNSADASSFFSLGTFGKARPVILAVGSERGWADNEKQSLVTAGAQRVSMGGRALRTETASIAAVMLAMERL